MLQAQISLSVSISTLSWRVVRLHSHLISAVDVLLRRCLFSGQHSTARTTRTHPKTPESEGVDSLGSKKLAVARRSFPIASGGRIEPQHRE